MNRAAATAEATRSAEANRKRRACKPGSVPLSGPPPSISSGGLPPDPRGQPMDFAKAHRAFARASCSPLLGLARSEACRAAAVADDAVGSYPAFSPLPSALASGGMFSVALSVPREGLRALGRSGLRERPGVTRRCALVSPDFPPRGAAGLSADGRLATAARPALIYSSESSIDESLSPSSESSS